MKNNDAMLTIESDKNSLKSLDTTISNTSSINNVIKDQTKIYLKSIQNTTTEVNLNLNNLVKNELSNILRSLNVTDITHDIKLIFSGKILSCDQTFSSYGILYYNVLITNFSFVKFNITQYYK
jgi:hypothetical protein